MQWDAVRLDPGVPGRGLVKASWYGTGLFTVTAAAAAIAPDVFRWPALVVALGLFAIGCVLFLWSYAVAVDRSRHDELSIAGLYFLTGAAPPAVQWHLMGSLGVETVVALTTASVRPFTTLAFGILVPVYGLGLAGLWSARHGTFAPRARPAPRPKRKSRDHG